MASEKERIVGDAKKKQIEVRYDDAAHTRLDEVVAFDAYVHLEQMNDAEYALIVETSKERACFLLSTLNYKAHVRARELWRDQISRRAEAARLRENKKREKKR